MNVVPHSTLIYTSELILCEYQFSLLYRHECFTGKYTTREIYAKLHPGLEWRIFHILISEDIDDFADIKFISQIVPKFVGE